MSKVPIDKTFLRHMFLKHKKFLKQVFESKNTKETKVILERGLNLQINTLLRILHLIVQEAIPIPYSIIKSISATNRKRFIGFGKNHSKLSKYLLKVPLNQKRAFLVRWASFLPKLLTPLFQNG